MPRLSVPDPASLRPLKRTRERLSAADARPAGHRWSHCTMIPLKICSSQAVEKGQVSGGVDSQFVLTWHVLCETERPRLAADLAQPRGPDGEVGRARRLRW